MQINILGYGVTTRKIVTLLNKNNIKCNIYDDNITESKDCINSYFTLKNVKDSNGNLSIISPGIPPSTPSLRHFSNIISEYDFFYMLIDFLQNSLTPNYKKDSIMPDLHKEKAKVESKTHDNIDFFSIWISGTNGKTTTTEMTALMLNAKSGGNIGTPLAHLFMQDFATFIPNIAENSTTFTTNIAEDSTIFTPNISGDSTTFIPNIAADSTTSSLTPAEDSATSSPTPAEDSAIFTPPFVADSTTFTPPFAGGVGGGNCRIHTIRIL